MEIRGNTPIAQFGRSGTKTGLRSGRVFCISHDRSTSRTGLPPKELSQKLCSAKAYKGRKGRPAIQCGTLRRIGRKLLQAFASHSSAPPVASATACVVQKSRKDSRRKSSDPFGNQGCAGYCHHPHSPAQE